MTRTAHAIHKTPRQRDVAHTGRSQRVDASLLALDEWLFNPSASAWLAIDAGNQRVGRVVVPSLAAGLELVGRGRVAAVVGRLRDGAFVVDVDVAGDFGHWVAHEIAGWLAQRGWWHLLRPSGGDAGRHHVFAVPAVETGRAELRSYLDGLIGELGLRRGELDLRDTVRPLSSPHRRGAVTRPRGDLAVALRRLKEVFPAPPEPALLRRRKSVRVEPSGVGAVAGDVVPLFLQRWRRQLRPGWRTYLLTGHLPAGDWAGRATASRGRVAVDRSLVEAAATRELVWAVGDPKIAWQLVRESHPAAMTKAKHQGFAWWTRYVWNPAVEGAGAFTRTGAPAAPAVEEPAAPDARVVAAVLAARRRLEELMWRQPVRTRPGLLLVGHRLLDRIARTGDLRVPCPERDLVLDTGISDRKTIRTLLRLLDGSVGTLHRDCLSAAAKATTSFEFEIGPPPARPEIVKGGWEIPPPSFHPPPAPTGLWGTLPRAAHSCWRVLLDASRPLALEEVARLAGQVEIPQAEPSKSQTSTVRTALAALGSSGLARVDETGHWRAATGPRSSRIDAAAAAEHTRLRTQIEAERTAYRLGTAVSRWSAARAGAIKAQRAKEKAWWSSLSPDERRQRSSRRREQFDELSISQQEGRKAQLAEGRRLAGLTEADVYQSWLKSLSPDEYAERSHQRRRRFAALSREEQALSVAAWNRHRTRYRLPGPAAGDPPSAMHTRTEHLAAAAGAEHTLFEATEHERDETFLDAQAPHEPRPAHASA